MSICCINPDCHSPENAEEQTHCQNCGSPLVFEIGMSYRVIWSDIGDKGQPWIAQKVLVNGTVMSRVYEATDGTQNSIVKVLYTTDETYVRLFEREVNVLNRLNKERRTSEEQHRFFPRIPKVPDHPECVAIRVTLNSQRYQGYFMLDDRISMVK